jgi:hypothetical protein
MKTEKFKIRIKIEKKVNSTYKVSKIKYLIFKANCVGGGKKKF